MKRIPRWRPDRLDLFAMLLLVSIVPAIFAPLLSHAIRGTSTTVPQSDFPPHSVLAAELREQRRVMIPHPLYHFVLIGVQRGLEMVRGNHQTSMAKAAVGSSRGEVDGEVLAEVSNQYAGAAIITNVFFVWLLSLILWMQIRNAAGIRGVGGAFAGVALVIALMIVAPIALLHIQDGRYYFGYIGINVWHNPTVIAAKPLVLITFLATLAGFPERSEPTDRFSFCHGVALATIVICGAMAKPSFLMCLLPAALFLAAFRQWFIGRCVRWGYLFVGLILPAILALGWQSWIYARYTGGAHAVFSPLATMSAMSRHLGPKLLLSILFPVVCYIAWWKQAKFSTRLNLAWLAFFVGLMFTYFVSETKRTRHGNFLWSAQLALFVLFVESTLFVIETARSKRIDSARDKHDALRGTLCGTALAFHFVFGVIYCVHLISTRGGSSWLTSSWWYH